jgi:hypothetical protein
MQSNTTGSNNAAFGNGALASNTTASNNTAVGYQAGYSNTTGGGLLALGYRAGYSNTTGTDNTALGYQSGYTNTTGGDNTSVGVNSLYDNTGSYNTAVGKLALRYSTTASGNTAVGYTALYATTTGGQNVAVGNSAGSAITTGQYNACFGKSAGQNITTGEENICIGYFAGCEAGVFNLTTQNFRVVMGENAITNAYIKVAWTVTSDARDKTNINPIPHGLDFVKQLNPVSYNFKKSREDDTPHGNKRYGFLAQDILALEGEENVIIDNEQVDHLKYQGEALVPVLVKAIQELKAEFDAYKASHP